MEINFRWLAGLVASPVAGWLVKTYVLDPITERRQKKKWAREYDKAGTQNEAPPAPPFAPVPPPTSEQTLHELRVTRARQVVVDVELLEAQGATHRLRTLLDESRLETANKIAELVVTRDDKDKALADLKRSRAEAEDWRKRFVEAQLQYAALEDKAAELKKQFDQLQKEGDLNVRRNRGHAAHDLGTGFAGPGTAPKLPAAPGVPGRRPPWPGKGPAE